MSLQALILRHRWFFAISLVLLMGLLAIFVGGKPASGAVNLSEEDFTQSPVATGLVRPTAMEFAPDGRLFVTEKGGGCASLMRLTLMRLRGDCNRTRLWTSLTRSMLGASGAS